MAFHDKLAYFTGYKYEPDPQPDDDAVMVEPEAVDELQSIVETIVREKAEQAPEDQAATAEGDTTFSDLMEQHEEAVDAEPEAMPSALDEVPADAAFEGMPVDRLMEPGDEELEPEGESDDWLTEMGLAGDEMGPPAEEAIEGQGQGGVSLEKALMGQPEEADRLGLDGMFAPGAPDEADEALADMFGGEPGYEDLVGEALGGGPGAEEGPPEPDVFEEVEDLLPDSEEDIAGPPSAAEYGDRGLLKSILLAEQKAAAAARKVLASDVTININIGDEGGEPDLEPEEPELEGLEGGEELEEIDLGESVLGEEPEELAEPPVELEGELGEEPGADFGEIDFGEEAAATVRRVLANDVTININIGDGEEVDIQAPDDIGIEPEVEEFGFDEDLGKDLGLEDLDEEGFGEELAPAKKGEGETFDELDDIANVFGDEESVGDKDDEIQEFGI